MLDWMIEVSLKIYNYLASSFSTATTGPRIGADTALTSDTGLPSADSVDKDDPPSSFSTAVPSDPFDDPVIPSGSVDLKLFSTSMIGFFSFNSSATGALLLGRLTGWTVDIQSSQFTSPGLPIQGHLFFWLILEFVSIRTS